MLYCFSCTKSISYSKWGSLSHALQCDKTVPGSWEHLSSNVENTCLQFVLSTFHSFSQNYACHVLSQWNTRLRFLYLLNKHIDFILFPSLNLLWSQDLRLKVLNYTAHLTTEVKVESVSVSEAWRDWKYVYPPDGMQLQCKVHMLNPSQTQRISKGSRSNMDLENDTPYRDGYSLWCPQLPEMKPSSSHFLSNLFTSPVSHLGPFALCNREQFRF